MYKVQDGEVIGNGHFGIVKKVKSENGEYVAVKIIEKKDIMRSGMIDQMRVEIELLNAIDHPKVIKMIDYEENDKYIYITSEYIEDGDLYNYIKTKSKLLEKEAALYVRQTIEALMYLHSLDIIHRDIKPDNILLGNDGIKLCDFGWAYQGTEKQTRQCGTVDYMAPEIVRNAPYGEEVDIWAVGILAYELVTGELPFFHETYHGTLKNIIKLKYIIPGYVSRECSDFIKRLLVYFPEQRLSLHRAYEHEWLN